MKNLLLFVFLAFTLLSCAKDEAPKVTEEEKTATVVAEHTVMEIKLAGDVAKREAEVSGMTWYKDWLVLLPQYPAMFSGNGQSVIYKIPKTRIEDYISGKDTTVIVPDTIGFYYESMHEIADKEGCGFEAIVFYEDKVFVTLEQREETRTYAYLIVGTFDEAANKIRLDDNSLKQVEREQNYWNFSEEALSLIENKLFSFYEANGINVNYRPIAFTDDLKIQTDVQVKVPNLEYRITDATNPDENNNIWLINYFYTGEYELLKPGPDSLVVKHGVGETHLNSGAVERLVELHYNGNEFVFTENAPLQLQLNLEETSRNWEGIARLDDKGLLIITDKYPRTILGFVEFDRQ